MKNKIFILGGGIFLLFSFCKPTRAADYLGADAVLHAAADHDGKPADAPKTDEQSKLREELKAFSAAATNLPPAEAAKQWLALVDRAVKLQRQGAMDYMSGGRPIESADLLDALPPPTAWNELAKAIAGRPAPKADGELHEMGLHFLAATLTGDKDAQNQEIAHMVEKAAAAGHDTAVVYRSYLERVSQATLALSDNPGTVMKMLERQLDSSQARHGQVLMIPNLVAQVGPEKAEVFLRRALVSPDIMIRFPQPGETSELAQKLAMELMPQLKQPQWELINSLSAVELYETMEKRFPEATNQMATTPGLPGTDLNVPDAGMPNDMGDNLKEGAQIYYMLGLISKGRAKEAALVAQKLDSRNAGDMFEQAFTAMQRAGFTEALDDFLNELLTQNPALPFWEQYVETAAQAGQTKRMLTTVRTALTNADLSEGKKAALHRILLRALLADDNSEEAVQEIRRSLAADDSDTANFDLNAGQLNALLARLGVLLNKPEWTEEGLKGAREWLAKNTGKNNFGGLENIPGTLAQILSGLKRGPEAEAVLLDSLAAATAPVTGHSYWPRANAQQPLTDLATLYHNAGRTADVLELLEKSPDWGAGDVSDLFNASAAENMISLNFLHTGTSPMPVPYLAAAALLAEGKTVSAQKITDALLDQDPGLDRGYELLLELQGTNAAARLDELFHRDQFEERPLIWKAHLLRGQGQFEAAEKLLRQAISIDPSDGEEGRGDRMRVYAELAEVRDARGDKKEADFFRGVVQAIRLSEDADQFYAVGLLKRAVAMYAEGLQHFSDAYCIQSRMAIQLSELGMTAEAEEHYRRAYELMPDSFGRVESHCFGCEKAFAGERPQSIAEKVFTQMAIERPDKPQIRYLLGYLRMEQERFNDARTNYLAAVRLDPDYLNAWVKMEEVSRQILMPPKERDDIVFNILRLDPLQRHAHPDYARVSDIAGLWKAVAAATAQQLVANTNLLTLTASKAALEKKKNEPGNQSETYYNYNSDKILSPAAAVAETPFVSLAGQMILNNGQMDE